MADVKPFVNRAARIEAAINSEVDRIGEGATIVLPSAGSSIVSSYLSKIEGSYDVQRAKGDTDNAINLLYIAYNTTPQKEGEVRVKIAGLMHRMILAQQGGARAMRGAMEAADRIVRSLGDTFQDWLDVKADGDRAEIKVFLSQDVVKLAQKVRTQSLQIRDSLLLIGTTYDGIIGDALAATASTERALGARLPAKAGVADEICKANADRERLESLVGDLRREVDRFDELAKDYESRASTAEERSFILSIIRMGAQTISQVVPAMAMAAGGPAPMLASSTLTALEGRGAGTMGVGQADHDVDDKAIETRKQLSRQDAELKGIEKLESSLKAEVEDLEAEKARLAGGSGEGASAGGTPASGGAQAAGFDQRIADKAEQLRAQRGERTRIEATVKALRGALGALDTDLATMGDGQQQAANLREMQMRMLDKVEKYETERRTQSAEFTKINALLIGKRTDDDTIKIAIRSLALSVSALKRAKEIVEEIAFLFKSFADVMGSVEVEAAEQARYLEATIGDGAKRASASKRVIASIDRFFITQTAEWHAVALVSERFNGSFIHGWSKMNTLSGTYITGELLSDYLRTVSRQLSGIAAEREAAASEKIASLDLHRAELRRQA